MRRPTFPLLLILPLLAGCGLEAYLPQQAPPPAPAIAAPPPPPPYVPPPFPPARLSADDAAKRLAADPMALRFLVLRRSAEETWIPVDEAKSRMASNLGALLPLTAGQAPAADLDRGLPPYDELMRRVHALTDERGKGNAATRGAERGYLLDQILPLNPPVRQKLYPPDDAAARRLLDRLLVLEDAGLVTPDQRYREQQAVQALIEGFRQAALQPVPLPPPPPPPKTKTGKGGKGGSGERPHRGFQPMVVPNPPGMDPPKLAPGATGPVGVHLLAMGSAAHGERAWAALTKEYPDLIKYQYKVIKADLGDIGVTYRLIAGPMDAAAAEALCAKIRGSNQECQPTPFPP